MEMSTDSDCECFVRMERGNGSREGRKGGENLSHGASPRAGASDGVEVAAGLRVDAAYAVDREGCVGGAERSGQSDLVEQHAALSDRVEDAVLGICVDGTVRVDGGGVDAPLESEFFVVGDRGIPKLPFLFEIGVELDHELAWIGPQREAVEVVFRDDGERSVVLPDRGRRIPAEWVRAEVRAGGGEVHQMALAVVVRRVCAVEDRSIGQYDRRGCREV